MCPETFNTQRKVQNYQSLQDSPLWQYQYIFKFSHEVQKPVIHSHTISTESLRIISDLPLHPTYPVLCHLICSRYHMEEGPVEISMLWGQQTCFLIDFSPLLGWTFVSGLSSWDIFLRYSFTSPRSARSWRHCSESSHLPHGGPRTPLPAWCQVSLPRRRGAEVNVERKEGKRNWYLSSSGDSWFIPCPLG